MINIDNSTFSCKPLKTREKPIKKKGEKLLTFVPSRMQEHNAFVISQK